MRILFVVPHFFDPVDASTAQHGSQMAAAQPRIDALARCVLSLHQLYGHAQCVMQIRDRKTESSNDKTRADVHVVICTTGTRHVLDRLPIDATLYQHFPTDEAPEILGFQCRTIFRDRWGNFDYYCYLEDDLVLHDPWLFVKLAWFNRHVGDDKLLLPNRFERSAGPVVHKAYVDGDISPEVTRGFQDLDDQPRLESEVMGVPVVFRRPPNPHSGCYFLNSLQMRSWVQQKHFLDRSAAFIGPLESAATLGVMRAFKIYKPAMVNASFLEVEHHGAQFIRQIRKA